MIGNLVHSCRVPDQHTMLESPRAERGCALLAVDILSKPGEGLWFRAAAAQVRIPNRRPKSRAPSASPALIATTTRAITAAGP